MNYAKHYQTRITPQDQPIPGSSQVPNSAGGFSFQVDDWKRLDRFLILGSEGGSYYASERKLTIENAEAVRRCLQADGSRTVARIREISEAGRAPKNDPALFALAMCAGLGDDRTRKAALNALPSVARIGTHLMHFAAYVEGFRGWGRGLRQAVADWYNERKLEGVAYQAIKYQSRDGWSQRDLLRLAHPQTTDGTRNAVYGWMVKGWEGVGDEPPEDAALARLWAFERAKRAETAREVAALVREYGLPREAVPTQYLGDTDVWAALLESMPMTAMIRNLATMTRVGLLAPMSAATQTVAAALGDEHRIRKARIHPIALLTALKTYAQGKGERSQHTWEPVAQIVDALDGAFYLSFDAIEPTGKRWVLALDVSGSMDWSQIAGMPGITPRIGSAAMALVTAATERQHAIVAFSHQMVPVSLSPRQRLDDVVRTVASIPMGGTDCALPMLWALQHNVQADVFTIYTDSETWAGRIHPVQALQAYRERTGIPARLIVVGMLSNGFSIADPGDAGMMDVVGFDTAAPSLIADFARGEL